MSTNPYSAGRDSNAGDGTAVGEPGDDDKLLKAFADSALAAEQRPTAGNDRQPSAEPYTYPTPRAGGRLGLGD
jgi:hypothetical protein